MTVFKRNERGETQRSATETLTFNISLRTIANRSVRCVKIRTWFGMTVFKRNERGETQRFATGPFDGY